MKIMTDDVCCGRYNISNSIGGINLWEDSMDEELQKNGDKVNKENK